MRFSLSALAAISGALAVFGAASVPANAVAYVETYETPPPGTGFAAILESPNGLAYDWYAARAFPRLAPYPITVLGHGDEAFYWCNNVMCPAPAFGLPGGVYSSNTTNYLFNGYGSGYENWELGINFTAGPTIVHSIDFGLANGSNAPSRTVNVIGYLAGDMVWNRGRSITGNVTLGLPAVAVDRIEIVRGQNDEPLFSWVPSGWYTLDNLTYEIPGAPTGTYVWKQYGLSELGDMNGAVPEPATWLSMILGFGLIGASARLRRRRAALG